MIATPRTNRGPVASKPEYGVAGLKNDSGYECFVVMGRHQKAVPNDIPFERNDGATLVPCGQAEAHVRNNWERLGIVNGY